MPHRFIRRATAPLVLVALLAGACGGGKEIGGDIEAKGGGGQGAIQRTSTTPAPTVATTAAATRTTAKPTPTTVPTPSATYKIQDDNRGQYIDPLHHTVRAGALVRFVNEDDTPHTISFKLGGSTVPSMNSPTIAPGGTWDLRPSQRGQFDIVDNERTYAVGATLTVS